MDVLSITPVSSNGSTKVLVISDAPTRYAWAAALPGETAQSMAEGLYSQSICVFGPPERLLSDRGRALARAFIPRLCKKLSLRRIFTSSYHSQPDGMVERLSRTILKGIRAYADGNDVAWHELLSEACVQYSTASNSATGITTFKPTSGVESLDYDAETVLRMQLDDRTVQDLSAQMRQLHTEVLRQTYRTRLVAEKDNNKSVSDRRYKMGDPEPVYDSEGGVAVGRGLRRPWLGPYRVTEKVTGISYVLIGEVTGKVARVTENRTARMNERLWSQRRRRGAFSQIPYGQSGVSGAGERKKASGVPRLPSAVRRDTNGWANKTSHRLWLRRTWRSRHMAA